MFKKIIHKKEYLLILSVLLFLAFCPQEVWAADSVFTKVRDKAASSLKDIKLVVYILGGFGLIGFAFMAIFNKISWKWFANIAMSLFLLSVMGLFIDDFTGTSTHSAALDYGNYLSGDGGIDGTGGDIGGGDAPEEGGGGGDQKTEKKEPCYDIDNGQYYSSSCQQVRQLSGFYLQKCTARGGQYISGVGCMVNGQTIPDSQLDK